MNHRANLEREAAYEPAVRSLIRSVNSRMGVRPAVGQVWVRVRPPTEEEMVDERLNPRVFVRFHRIGSSAKVVSVLPDFVELQCAGETIMLGVVEFTDSWVRLIADGEWGSRT
jgi:hypothetical protein